MSGFAAARLALAAMVCAAPLAAPAHDQHERRHSAEDRNALSADYAFPLPEPGSYRLPTIRAAVRGSVLDEEGRPHDLLEFLHGRITVLTFMYTQCGDICPTATLQMSRLRDLAGLDQHLAGRIQLLSMSFDPDHDTPSVMSEYASSWRSADLANPQWHFLTAPNRTALAPILAAYDQSINAKTDSGAAGGPLYHVFRAFLVDPSGRIRNIYSLDFLDPELVLNDIRTLMIDLGRDDHQGPP